eukprot:5600005-Pleurochrysis_carterae.AAC.2
MDGWGSDAMLTALRRCRVLVDVVVHHLVEELATHDLEVAHVLVEVLGGASGVDEDDAEHRRKFPRRPVHRHEALLHREHALPPSVALVGDGLRLRPVVHHLRRLARRVLRVLVVARRLTGDGLAASCDKVMHLRGT